jgi:O-Antigen ligase
MLPSSRLPFSMRGRQRREADGSDLVAQVALLSIPFYSLPITDAMLYRPVSAVLFALLSIYFFTQRIAYVFVDFLLILFTILAVAQTIIIMALFDDKLDVAVRNCAPLVLGVLCYFGAAYTIRRLGICNFVNILSWTGAGLVIFGWLELFSNIVHFSGIKEILFVLTDEIHEDRIQLFTREASWAAKCITFYIPFLTHKATSTPSLFFKLIAFGAWGLLGATFSLDGIVGVMLGLCLYGMVVAFKTREFLQVVLIVIILAAIAAVLYGIFAPEIVSFLDTYNFYFIDRITSSLRMDEYWDALTKFAFADDSTFIRLFYPIAGFRMFLDYPLGSGLGSFALHFQQYVPLDYIQFELMPELENSVVTGVADPKSLYSKIAAECGLVSGVPIIAFLFLCGRSVYRSNGPYSRCILLSYCLMLGVLLQFGSFLYVPMWLVFALCLDEYRGAPDRPRRMIRRDSQGEWILERSAMGL